MPMAMSVVMDAAAADGGEEERAGGGDWFQNLVNFALDEGVFGLAQATVEQTTSIAGFVASAATSAAVHVVSDVGRLLTGPFANNDVDKRRSDECTQRDAPFVLQIAFDLSDLVLGAIVPKGSTAESIKMNRHSNHHSACEVKLIKAGIDANSLDEFHDADCGESLYFDALGSTGTLSTASFTSSTDSYDESDQPFPKSVTVRDASTYYLDVAMIAGVDRTAAQLLSSEENDAGDTFCCITDGDEGVDSLNQALEVLVDVSLRTAFLDVTSSDDGLINLNWRPDGHTDHILKRCTGEELTDVMESEVLKWTSSLNGNSLLKTQGVVNMRAIDLKELLLDCERAHLFNKNSVNKEDVTKLHGVESGEAKIVKNVLSIPVVGGTIQTLSLTHSRRIGGGGFVIVSISVNEELARPSNSSVYSISILRPVQNSTKTELTNIIQSSALPIPKFLMRRVSFMGATDFFCNLRRLCE